MPNTTGRRDPNIARRIAAERAAQEAAEAAAGVPAVDQDALDAFDYVQPDAGEDEVDAGALRPGDEIFFRIHHPMMIDGSPSNVTYGVTTTVWPGETEEAASERVVGNVVHRVIQGMDEAMHAVRNYQRSLRG